MSKSNKITGIIITAIALFLISVIIFRFSSLPHPTISFGFALGFVLLVVGVLFIKYDIYDGFKGDYEYYASGIFGRTIAFIVIILIFVFADFSFLEQFEFVNSAGILGIVLAGISALSAIIYIYLFGKKKKPRAGYPTNFYHLEVERNEVKQHSFWLQPFLKKAGN